MWTRLSCTYVDTSCTCTHIYTYRWPYAAFTTSCTGTMRRARAHNSSSASAWPAMPHGALERHLCCCVLSTDLCYTLCAPICRYDRYCGRPTGAQNETFFTPDQVCTCAWCVRVCKRMRGRERMKERERERARARACVCVRVVCVCVCARANVVCTHACMLVCVLRCSNACSIHPTFVCVYLCSCLCVYIYMIYVYMYTHTTRWGCTSDVRRKRAGLVREPG